MGLLLSINHLLNFLAPAFVLGALMPFLGRWMGFAAAWPARWWQQSLLHALLGWAVLLAGLWLGGRDAMMASYGALVLASGTLQWALALRRRG